MVLKGDHGFFTWLVILTIAWLELIILWRILYSEILYSDKQCEKASCFKGKDHQFAHSGGLSDSARPIDIALWHNWNNLGACKNLKFFGGRIWRGAVKYRENMNGHKAVCLDGNIRPVPGNCLVYSFGVKNDWSFEDAMMKYGCEVYGFDPSIIEPKQTGVRKFIFYKIGLQGKDEVNKRGWEMKSLRSIMKLLGHENRIIDVLKMDIEESEYEAIPNMIDTGNITPWHMWLNSRK
ncbi:uncharacterized protein LOC136029074 isoform X2 [Artemia franciscana]